MKFLLLLIVLLVLFSGCVNQPQNEVEIIGETESPSAIISCKDICKNKLTENVNLSNGPCLSDNNANWTISDWVCDIAHSPRQPEIDDKPENQCQNFRNGQAHHFVEVNITCGLIRAV